MKKHRKIEGLKNMIKNIELSKTEEELIKGGTDGSGGSSTPSCSVCTICITGGANSCIYCTVCTSSYGDK